jgi:thioredoxin reductase
VNIPGFEIRDHNGARAQVHQAEDVMAKKREEGGEFVMVWPDGRRTDWELWAEVLPPDEMPPQEKEEPPEDEEAEPEEQALSYRKKLEALVLHKPRSEYPSGKYPSEEAAERREGGGQRGAPARETERRSHEEIRQAQIRHTELRDEWATVNHDLQKFAEIEDGHNYPEAKALMERQKQIVKEQYRLHADPGGHAGLTFPGGPRDVLVIGGGPGGLAAGIMAGTDGLDTLVVEASPEPGGQSRYSARIENLPGFPLGISGRRLAKRMFDQAERVGADTRLGVHVTSMTHDPETGMKTVTLSNGEVVEARVVIVSGGVKFREHKFPGREHVRQFGPSEPLGRTDMEGKAVAVVGGSNSAGQSAQANAHRRDVSAVHVISRSPVTDKMSDYQVRGIQNHAKIDITENDQVSHVEQRGDDTILVTQNGKEFHNVGAVGSFIGAKPNTQWLPKSIETKDEKPERGKKPARGPIVTNRHLETSMPGVFAVGDVKVGGKGRIGIAIGDGQTAAANAFQFFEKMERTEQRRTRAENVARAERWRQSQRKAREEAKRSRRL